MGGPEKSGYSGGKLLPKEKDLINGIWLAKSLQAFEAISIFPFSYENVENISQVEKINARTKIISSNLCCFINLLNFFTPL